ncbi:MAG: asparaginase [Acidobacteriota bacterium]
MPKVLLIHTGGTLGMRPRQPDQALAPDEFGPTLLSLVPELHEIADVDTRVVCNLDSSDLTPSHWSTFAETIASEIANYDGMVITHGTDAMAYTASALSYLLRDLPRPVILTGSQRPLAEPRSDARGNLVGAVELATRDIPEVGIYFDGRLLRGNRATKRSSFRLDAYRSPNLAPIAEVGTDIVIGDHVLRPQGPFRFVGDFDRHVACLRLLPGQRANVISGLRGSGIRGLLVEAFGVGNLPSRDHAVAEALATLVEDGVVVAIGSQVQHGRVDLMHYAGGRLASDVGAVGIEDMTLEAATVKLMYLLGTLTDVAAVKEQLRVPIAGEMTL